MLYPDDETESDTPCTVDIIEIVNILVCGSLSGYLIRNWLQFYDLLQAPSSEIHQWKIKYSNGTLQTYELFSEVINNWVCQRPSAATVENLCQILSRMGCNDASEKLEQLRGRTICSLQRISAFQNNRSGWFFVPQPVSSFVGRKEELAQIEKAYRDGIHNIVIVSGFPGIGKSEIAKKYCKDFYENKNGMCVWIEGSTDKDTNQSLRQLEKKFVFNLPSCSNLLEMFQSFCQVQKPNPLLIVIDNVDEQNNTVKEILEVSKMQQCPLPFFIITSRHKTLLQGAGVIIEMDFLPPAVAAKLVRGSLRHEKDKVQIEMLCKKLHYFPLVLQQAISFIKQQNITQSLTFSIADYLEILETKQKELFSFPLNIEQQYKFTTIAVFGMTLNVISSSGEVGQHAVELLRILSYSNSNGVGLKNLVNFENLSRENGWYYWLANKLGFNSNYVFDTEDKYFGCKKEIEMMIMHSICKLHKRNNEIYISIHRLVQDAIRMNWNASNEYSFLKEAISTEFLMMERTNGKYFQIHSFIKHAKRHAKLHEEYYTKLLQFDSNNFETLGDVAYFNYYLNNYKCVKNLGRESSEFETRAIVFLCKGLKSLDWSLEFLCFYRTFLQLPELKFHLNQMVGFVPILIQAIKDNTHLKALGGYMLYFLYFELQNSLALHEPVERRLTALLEHPSELIRIYLIDYYIFIDSMLTTGSEHLDGYLDTKLPHYLVIFGVDYWAVKKFATSVYKTHSNLETEVLEYLAQICDSELSVYDLHCIFRTFKAEAEKVSTVSTSLSGKMHENKSRVSKTFLEVYQVTNDSSLHENVSRLMSISQKSSLIANSENMASNLQFENDQFVWKEKFRYSIEQNEFNSKLKEHIFNFRVIKAESILKTMFESMTKNLKVDRQETFWCIKELVRFLWTAEKWDVALHYLKNLWLLERSSSELSIIQKTLESLAFTTCLEFFHPQVRKGAVSKYGFFSTTKEFTFNADSAIDLLIMLLQFDIHLPLLDVIVQISNKSDANGVSQLKSKLEKVLRNNSSSHAHSQHLRKCINVINAIKEDPFELSSLRFQNLSTLQFLCYTSL